VDALRKWQQGRFRGVATREDTTGGRQKKSTGPAVNLLNLSTHPPTIRHFFLDFFLVRFWDFLGKGSSKTSQKCFCSKSKSMSKTFSKKIDKNFDVRSSSTFFVLSRFRVFLSDRSSKTLQKTFGKKNRVENILQKFDQKSQTDFFSISFYHVFGRFSVRRVQKHDLKKYRENKSDPIPFSCSDHPPTTGVPGFFFAGPLRHHLLATRARTRVARWCISLARAYLIYPGIDRSIYKYKLLAPWLAACSHLKWPA
jgi:hypothetical protein